MYLGTFNCFLKNSVKQARNIRYLRHVSSRYNHQSQQPIIIYGEDVLRAKEKSSPIVALESTIITHGMPYPDNLNTAFEVEDIIRQKGGTPATIAIVDGKIKVGATNAEIERLAKSRGKNVIKVSRRDLSYAISQGISGGTTVSSTILVARKAGIPIMATGGIGGVHRQVDLSMDISTDLKELGQTSVAVVCSGVKAILDIPKTLEYLESEGVPVATIGSDGQFPAFYSRCTAVGLLSPIRLNNAEEAARLIDAQTKLALGNGVLIAVPIPEEYSLDPHEIEAVIKKALEEARLKNIRGKNVTPFLLEQLSKLTAGQSLESNKALIKNNASVAADIALNLDKIQRSALASDKRSSPEAKKNPVVIGGATYDTVLRVIDSEIKFNGSTHRGESTYSCGGVGRNLAAALLKLNVVDTKFLSVVGDDEAGRAVVDSLGDAATTVHTSPDIGTARYTAVVDNKGNCCFGIGEMDAFKKIDHQFLYQHMETLKNTPLLVMDGNPPLDAMNLALDFAVENHIPVWYEPTDLQKALKIFECEPQWQKVLSFVSPNVNELLEMAKYFHIPIPSNVNDIQLEAIKNIAENLLEYVPVIIATLGPEGVLVTRRSPKNTPFLDEFKILIETDKPESHLYRPLKITEEIRTVSGCGDCLAAGIITGILRGWRESSCVSLGLHAAQKSLLSHEAVPDTLKSLSSSEEDYIKNY